MSKKVHYEKRKDDKEPLQSFQSENRYRKEKDKEWAEVEKELSELEAKNRGEEVDEDSNQETIEAKEKAKDKSEGDQDSNWKKRYGDLRSHASRMENEFRAEIQKLQEQINEKQEALPTTDMSDEEFEEWAGKYPKVAAAMQRIALKNSEKVSKETKSAVDELAREKAQIARDRAYAHLLKIQPDFEDIVQDEKFQEWFADQSQGVKDLIDKPTFDEQGAKGAASVVKMYKSEFGLSDKKKEDTTRAKKASAAQRVSKSVSDTPETDDGEPKFTESQIADMTDKEFEKNMDAILAAQRKGPPHFIYDLSGGAR